MRLMLAADGSQFFLSKYLHHVWAALRAMGHEPLILAPAVAGLDDRMSENVIADECFADLCRSRSTQRFARMLEISRQSRAERVHLCFVDDVSALAAGIGDLREDSPPRLSISVFGLGAFRNDAYEAAYNELVFRGAVALTLMHSNHPDVACSSARAMGVLNNGAVRYLHDPIYDSPDLFSHEKYAARMSLGIGAEEKIVLYFGTFPRKKGADLLIRAAHHCKTREVRFLFAGSLATAESGYLGRADFDWPNVRLDDRIVDEEDAGLYFRSADWIVLPYRRFYECDTSGVFVQSCLAHRPMIVPNFAPFRETVEQYGLGVSFRCNDEWDLARTIDKAIGDPTTRAGGRFDAYLASHSTWDDFARALVDA
ncbi:glycosyltransferase [Trinickia sp. LjRoot230]|uniref:glycosyltransferase n=1 Tax=Trinickia sp. LjRoot230 TaxID=3342288 RepID=UPI003ED05C39